MQGGKQTVGFQIRNMKLHILIKYVQQCVDQFITFAQQLYSFIMTKIEYTNLIIDDFSLAKRETNRTYTHILTHIHTDHLKGLHDGWSYGPIYCTQSTKALLLYKFPNIPNIITLPLQTPTQIRMSATLSVTVTFFDANHCIGGGYMGRVLYTGDMRFDRQIFKKYSYLYPPQKFNQKFQRCSKPIDILYVDNTFLKKKFNFPPKHVVLKMAKDYIQQLLDLNQLSRVFIGLDSFGKQEVLVELATHFNMYIVVDPQRYELIRQTPLDIELFTTNRQQGVVEVVRKDKLYSRLKQEPESLGIILSGWVNQPTYKYNSTIYCLPYSLHSNYEEIHQFVNSIRPSFIYPIVHEFPDQNRLFYAGAKDVSKKDLMFNQQLFQEEKGNYKLQIEELRFLYSSPPTEDYKSLINNVELQKKIEEQLRPPNLSNLFTSQKVAPLNMQVVERKKYKLANKRNQLEINRLKNQIKLKKKILEGQSIEAVQDLDGKSFDLSDNSKNKSEVIEVDDYEELQTMKDEPAIIDPLYEPMSNPSKNRPFGIKERKRSRNSFTGQHKYNKQGIRQLKPNIQNRVEDKQETSKPIQISSQNESKSKNESVENIIYQQTQEKVNEPIEVEKPMVTPVKCQYPQNKVQKSYKDIDLHRVKTIKILGKKEDVLNHLKKSPQQLQHIRQLFSNQKTSVK